jgi:hypothetical protein
MKYAWRDQCIDIAIDLIFEHGQEVEYLAIIERVGETTFLSNEMNVDPVAYVLWLIDNADIEITFPKARL